MNELPSYPTPRQAAYVVPPGANQAPSSRKKPAHSSNMSYKPPQSSSYGSNYQVQPQLSGPQHQQPPPRQQPVQQVHFHQQTPQPPQPTPPQSSYYQQSAPPPQPYSQPPPQQQYYGSQNSLAAAPTPQQAYYQAQPPPPPPQQYQQAPQHQAPQHQAPHHHSPNHTYQQPVPMSNSSSQNQAPQQQRYESNAIKKPPPQGSGSYSRSKESFVEPTPPKQSSKQKLENELRAVFDKVDVNNSGRISKQELSNALLNFDHTRFQESTIVLMINLFTNPNSNSKHLNFDQFVSLWKYLSAYKKLFVQADTNNSGDISFGEFQKVLEQIGYKLNIDLVLHLFQKFSYKDQSSSDSGPVGKLKFDKFIELLVYLRKLTDIFKKYDKDLSGVATINFSDFLFEVSNLS